MTSYAIGPVPAWIVAELAARGVVLEPVAAPAEVPEAARLVVLAAAPAGAIAAVRTAAPLAIVAAWYREGEEGAALAAVAGEAEEVLVEPIARSARPVIIASILRHRGGRCAEVALARHVGPALVFRGACDTPTLELVGESAARLGFPVPSPEAWHEAIHPADRAEVDRRRAAALAGEPQTFVHRMRGVDGGHRWVRAELRRVGGALLGSLVDVTGERRLEESLSQLVHDWRATLDAISMEMALVDADGRILRVNAAARSSLGGRYLDLIGARLEDFAGWQPWATAAALCAQVSARRCAMRQRSHPDADGRVWDVTVEPLISPGDHACRAIVVCHEVSDDLRLRRALEANERMASVGNLVAGVAHEVRNPLFGISAIADALELRFQERGEPLPHLAMLRAVVARLSRLMHDLLALGSTSRLDLEPVVLGEVIEDARNACAALATERDVAVAVAIEPTLTVELDRGRMAQVIQNLLDNALRHAPPGSWVDVAAVASDDRLRLTVRDRGPGFGAHRARALEPFFSRRKDGTGLGLPIVVQIVQRHGGTVTLDDAHDGGAVVRVEIPLAAARAA